MGGALTAAARGDQTPGMDDGGPVVGRDPGGGRSWLISLDPETGLIAVAEASGDGDAPAEWRILGPREAERMASALAAAVAAAQRSGGPLVVDLRAVLDPE